MSAHFQRAVLLIEQSRFEMAESELRQALVQSPNNAKVHSYLAICLVELNRYKEATQAAETAIGLAPDSALSYYAASWVSAHRNDYKSALKLIIQSIEIEPENPQYFAHLSRMRFSLKDWKGALLAADSGLALDAENMACINMRAMALVKLGRKVQAASAIESALERQPEDAVTHANMGWSLLEQGKPEESMPHFREALRLEPTMEWARAGIVEAMKSHYFVYRIVLGWFLWASKLDGRTLWMILIGGYFGCRFLISVAEKSPALRPVVIPLIIVYVAFAIMTWVSVPLFNLLLRFNRFGRLALSDQERRTSTWVGCCLLTAIVLVASYFVFGSQQLLYSALAIGLMTPALATFYNSDIGWPRAIHGLLLSTMTILAAFVLVFHVGDFVTSGDMKRLFGGFASTAALPLLLLGVASQFGVQFLAMARPRKGTRSEFWVWLIGGIVIGAATIIACTTVAVAVTAI